jgi:putative transposase
MTQKKKSQKEELQKHLPDPEELARELAAAESIDDFYGKDGIFARMFSKTIEQMLEAELTEELGYERYEAEGRNSGNSRNGHYQRKMRTSGGDADIRVPRDRQGEFQSELLKKNSNEIEQKIIAMYARGTTMRDIQAMLNELYGISVSPDTISKITDKVWPLVEEWQNRPLAAIYAMVYLDALHLKIKKDGKIENVAVYNVLGVDLEGKRDVLGHWIGDGGEGANFSRRTSGRCGSLSLQTCKIGGCRIFSSLLWMVWLAFRMRSILFSPGPKCSAASSIRSATL